MKNDKIFFFFFDNRGGGGGFAAPGLVPEQTDPGVPCLGNGSLSDCTTKKICSSIKIYEMF